jgi:hypothetical protein
MAAMTIGVAVALLALGYLPTRTVSGPDGLAGMGAGVGIALLAALAGLIPSIAALRRPVRERLTGILLGMAIRFALTIGLLLVALFSGLHAKAALVLWAGIGYVVLVGTDTAGIVWLTKRCTRTSP